MTDRVDSTVREIPVLAPKTGILYLILLALWALTLGFLCRAWLLLPPVHPTGLETFVLALDGVCIAAFSLFGLWHLVVVVFHLLSRVRDVPTGGRPHLGSPLPRVAVLYVTCDDFCAASARTCVELDYPSLTLFVLDDSTTGDYRKQVDQFAGEWPDIVKVIRRGTRAGYKAGNINHALQNHLDGYEYIVIADADEELPMDFVRQALAAFQQDERVAFVQAKHLCSHTQTSPFARDLSGIIDAMWEFYQDYRNQYGLVPCLGHGVMIRVTTMTQVGGVPSVISDDLALTMALRSAGYVGRFAHWIIAREGFPTTLADYRKRFSRWTKADCECFLQCVVPFLQAASISWFEKLDLVLREIRMALSAVILPVLCLNGMMAFVLQAPFFASWEFVLTATLCFLAPMSCMLLMPRRSLSQQCRLIGYSISVYLSLAVVSTLAVFQFALGQRVHFTVTGAQLHAPEKLGANSMVTLGLELLTGTFLLGLGIQGSDLVLTGIGTALVLAPVYSRGDWERLAVRLAALLPCVIVTAGVIMSVLGLSGHSGSLFYIMGFAVLLFS